MNETVGTIYVGNKPLPSYLQAVYFAQERGAKEVKLIARGRPILTAIDVASILQRNGGIIRDIEIGSIKKPDYPGYASTIEIDLEF